MIYKIADLEGIQVEGTGPEMAQLERLHHQAASVAFELLRETPWRVNRDLSLAISSAVNLASVFLASMRTRCYNGNPPADIDLITGGDGNLVYRCMHHPSHEFDYETGKQLK